jgi:hypothetical protein
MTDALIAFIESSKEKWEMSGSKVWQGRAGQGRVTLRALASDTEA